MKALFGFFVGVMVFSGMLLTGCANQNQLMLPAGSTGDATALPNATQIRATQENKLYAKHEKWIQLLEAKRDKWIN
jgi:hypothetical protein